MAGVKMASAKTLCFALVLVCALFGLSSALAHRTARSSILDVWGRQPASLREVKLSHTMHRLRRIVRKMEVRVVKAHAQGLGAGPAPLSSLLEMQMQTRAQTETQTHMDMDMDMFVARTPVEAKYEEEIDSLHRRIDSLSSTLPGAEHLLQHRVETG
jgi:hypothetical protein